MKRYGMIPARRFTHDPFRLGSTAKAFLPVAASFRLDARLVRDLSSAYLRGTKNLPSDFCHPNCFSTQSAPVLATPEEALGFASDLFEGLVGSRRPSPLRRDHSSEGKVFACQPRGDLRL